MQPESWIIRHFSIALPQGSDRGDVPKLLRHVADQIETYGDVEIQDLVFRTEIEAGELCHSATVYFHQVDVTTDD